MILKNTTTQFLVSSPEQLVRPIQDPKTKFAKQGISGSVLPHWFLSSTYDDHLQRRQKREAVVLSVGILLTKKKGKGKMAPK